MASIQSQVNELTGITDVRGDSTALQTAITTWCDYAISELGFLMPPKALQQMTGTSDVDDDDGLTLTAAGIGKIISVRRTHPNGTAYSCRLISNHQQSRAQDPEDLMYATTTDPVYFFNTYKLFVLPVPTTVQKAIVQYLDHSGITYATSTITEIPQEVEHLIILYVAIKAAESLLSSEEDTDFYVPMINNLKQTYNQAIQIAGANVQLPQKAASSSSQNQQMQKLLTTMMEYGKQ